MKLTGATRTISLDDAKYQFHRAFVNDGVGSQASLDADIVSVDVEAVRLDEWRDRVGVGGGGEEEEESLTLKLKLS